MLWISFKGQRASLAFTGIKNDWIFIGSIQNFLENLVPKTYEYGLLLGSQLRMDVEVGLRKSCILMRNNVRASTVPR